MMDIERNLVAMFFGQSASGPRLGLRTCCVLALLLATGEGVLVRQARQDTPTQKSKTHHQFSHGTKVHNRNCMLMVQEYVPRFTEQLKGMNILMGKNGKAFSEEYIEGGHQFDSHKKHLLIEDLKSEGIAEVDAQHACDNAERAMKATEIVAYIKAGKFNEAATAIQEGTETLGERLIRTLGKRLIPKLIETTNIQGLLNIAKGRPDVQIYLAKEIGDQLYKEMVAMEIDNQQVYFPSSLIHNGHVYFWDDWHREDEPDTFWIEATTRYMDWDDLSDFEAFLPYILEVLVLINQLKDNGVSKDDIYRWMSATEDSDYFEEPVTFLQGKLETSVAGATVISQLIENWANEDEDGKNRLMDEAKELAITDDLKKHLALRLGSWTEVVNSQLDYLFDGEHDWRQRLTIEALVSQCLDMGINQNDVYEAKAQTDPTYSRSAIHALRKLVALHLGSWEEVENEGLAYLFGGEHDWRQKKPVPRPV